MANSEFPPRSNDAEENSGAVENGEGGIVDSYFEQISQMSPDARRALMEQLRNADANADMSEVIGDAVEADTSARDDEVFYDSGEEQPANTGEQEQSSERNKNKVGILGTKARKWVAVAALVVTLAGVGIGLMNNANKGGNTQPDNRPGYEQRETINWNTANGYNLVENNQDGPIVVNEDGTLEKRFNGGQFGNRMSGYENPKEAAEAMMETNRMTVANMATVMCLGETTEKMQSNLDKVNAAVGTNLKIDGSMTKESNCLTQVESQLRGLSAEQQIAVRDFIDQGMDKDSARWKTANGSEKMYGLRPVFSEDGKTIVDMKFGYTNVKAGDKLLVIDTIFGEVVNRGECVNGAVLAALIDKLDNYDPPETPDTPDEGKGANTNAGGNQEKRGVTEKTDESIQDVNKGNQGYTPGGNNATPGGSSGQTGGTGENRGGNVVTDEKKAQDEANKAGQAKDNTSNGSQENKQGFQNVDSGTPKSEIPY